MKHILFTAVTILILFYVAVQKTQAQERVFPSGMQGVKVLETELAAIETMVKADDALQPDAALKIVAIYDVYYIHYVAAMVHLADGDVAGCDQHVKEASQQLDKIIDILKGDFQKHNKERAAQ